MPVWTPKEFAKELERRSKRRVKQAKDAAFVVAQRGVYMGAEVTEELGLTDQGVYKQRFKARRTADGAELRNDAPHAAVIEYGRRPGARRPPTGPIAAWVRRKLGKDPAEARRIAFVIARAIGRRGLPPHAVFRKHLNPRLRRMYQAELRKITKTRP